MNPFNTHEKRLFVQMYVAAYLADIGAIAAEHFLTATMRAEECWDNALAAGLIQDHDDDQQEQTK